MKTLIASVVSLLLGVAIGWYAGRRHFHQEKTLVVDQMVEGGESADRERAVRAVRAIESIQSGDYVLVEEPRRVYAVRRQ